MSKDECIHGLGPISACTICNGRAAAERKAANAVDYSFTAKFDGPLACGHHSEIGDQLHRLGDGRIVCDECVS